jgi:sporadic carbohydrate cluster protein (TIGR04323 family)
MKGQMLFAFLDVSLMEEVPQGLQHILITDAIAKGEAQLSFYSTESFFTLKTQSILRATVRKRPQIDGFIFYRLQQFALDGTMNLDLMREVLKADYALHFVRERLSIGNISELDTARAHLRGFAFVNDRARRLAFLDQVQQALGEAGRSAISFVG